MVFPKLTARLLAPMKHYAKLILRNAYRERYKQQKDKKRELERLKNLPKYQSTKTVLFGKEIALVDAHTFLSGYREIFEHNFYEFKTSSNSPYIIDCGANIGLSVIYFTRIFPNAEVVAFEPDPAIFECLEKNVHSFGKKNVQLYKAAVWNEDTEVEFQVEGAYSG